MPKLYEYKGLVIFFYSNEHEPIHVHAQFGEEEGKIEIILEMGQIIGLKYKSVSGKKSLNRSKRLQF